MKPSILDKIYDTLADRGAVPDVRVAEDEQGLRVLVSVDRTTPEGEHAASNRANVVVAEDFVVLADLFDVDLGACEFEGHTSRGWHPADPDSKGGLFTVWLERIEPPDA